MGTALPGYITNVWDFRLIALKHTHLVHEKGSLALNMIMNPIVYILLDVVHMMLDVSEVSKKASI